VNTYGYNWNTTNHSAMTIPLRTAKTMPNIHWDAAYKEAHAAYRDASGFHVAWFGTEQSLKDKIDLARRYHLYGIAIWKVGYEDAAFWKTLLSLNGPASAGGGTAAAKATRGAFPGASAPTASPRGRGPAAGAARAPVPPIIPRTGAPTMRTRPAPGLTPMQAVPHRMR
jgi:hypothetical protein